MRQETANTRLTIDLPVAMHRLVKAHASLKNISIKDFVINAISNDLNEEKVSEKQLNKKTIAALRYSIKNPHKLKSFDNSADAMKWLLTPDKTKKKTTKKNAKS